MPYESEDCPKWKPPAWLTRGSSVSIQQTWTCKKCQRENPQDASVCRQFGADKKLVKRPAFIIAAGLTAVPFIIIPILVALDSDSGMYFEELFFFLGVAVLMGIYLVVGMIVSAVLRLLKKDRAINEGILAGLAVGVLLGMASCTVSLATIS